MTALLIDDEPLACVMLRELLEAYPEIEIIGECHNGYEGLKAINSLKPDLIFLDVQMPKITGFEMLELVEDPPQVIFVTAYDEYALKAFDANALDYLLKPLEPARLAQALEKAAIKKNEAPQPLQLPHTPEQSERVVVKDGNEIVILPLPDIEYVEAAADYIKIHTHKKYYLKHQTMTAVEEQLPASQYLRVHRSYIVRIDAIQKLDTLAKDGYALLLKSGVSVPVSKSGYIRLKTKLGW